MTFEQWWAEVTLIKNHSIMPLNEKQIASGAWNRAISEVMMRRKDVNWDDPEQNSINSIFTETPE